MGVHLVFFLHITTGPDNTNNVLALAFGVLIVMLVMVGSLWIMSHLNHNMMPMDQMHADAALSAPRAPPGRARGRAFFNERRWPPRAACGSGGRRPTAPPSNLRRRR